MQFHSPSALRILEKNDALVDHETKTVRIHEALIKQALATAPKSFRLGARLTENDFLLPSDRSGYVLDNDGIYMRDFKTGERRITNFQDNLDILRVFDEMEFASLV